MSLLPADGHPHFTEQMVAAVFEYRPNLIDRVRFQPTQPVSPLQFASALNALAGEKYQQYAGFYGLDDYHEAPEVRARETVNSIEAQLKYWIRYEFYGLEMRVLSFLLKIHITHPTEAPDLVNSLLQQRDLTRPIFWSLETHLLSRGYPSLVSVLDEVGRHRVGLPSLPTPTDDVPPGSPREIGREYVTEQLVARINGENFELMRRLRYRPDQEVTIQAITRALLALSDDELIRIGNFYGLWGGPRTRVTNRITTIESRLKAWIRYEFYGLSSKLIGVLIANGATSPQRARYHINDLVCGHHLSQKAFAQLQAFLDSSDETPLIELLNAQSLRRLHLDPP